MKLCLVGKWPPIQGGVTRNNFLTALALARHGFEVHVVTNGPEVEPEFRTWDYFAPPGSAGGGLLHLDRERVRVHTTAPLEHPYIPYANPYLSKLATLAAEVVTASGADLILGVYFEPYGMAAHLASRWTGKPYVLAHAGSDISRLLPSSQLNRAHAEMLRAASLVFTGPRSRDVLLDAGVTPDQMRERIRVGTVREVFRPDAAPLDLPATLECLRLEVPSGLAAGLYHRLAAKTPNPSLPTIGIYGKVGETKGSLDLVHALGALRREGLRFNLLALVGGWPERMAQFAAALEAEDLESAAWLLPFVPFYQVPHFIRSCSAVCFLERDFAVKTHTPLVPQEVLACGACLVLSREIAAKRWFGSGLAHGVNAFLVDPKDHAELAGVLRRIVADPKRADEVGKRGYQEVGARLALPLDTFGRVLARDFHAIRDELAWRRQARGLEELATAAQRLRTGECGLTGPEEQVIQAVAGRIAALRHHSERKRRLAAAYELTAGIDCGRFEHACESYCRSHRADEPGSAAEFGAYLADCIRDSGEWPSYAAAVARYERLRVQLVSAGAAPAEEECVPPAEPVPTSTPQRRPGVLLESFECDVLGVVKDLRRGEVPDPVHSAAPLILAATAGPKGARFFRLNADAWRLLQLADGRTSLAAIIESFQQASARADVPAQVMRSLLELRGLGLIAW